jgi:hypothetical protein
LKSEPVIHAGAHDMHGEMRIVHDRQRSEAHGGADIAEVR